MPSRATVASTSGRALGSNASWPFSVRATQDANRVRLSRSGSACSSAKASESDRPAQLSSCADRSISRCFSPTLMVPKASSLTRMAGRFGVSAAPDVECAVMVAVGEYAAGELEQQEIEGRIEVASELALDDGRADGPQVVGESDADARFLARLGFRIAGRSEGSRKCGRIDAGKCVLSIGSIVVSGRVRIALLRARACPRA